MCVEVVLRSMSLSTNGTYEHFTVPLGRVVSSLLVFWASIVSTFHSMAMLGFEVNVQTTFVLELSSALWAVMPLPPVLDDPVPAECARVGEHLGAGLAGEGELPGLVDDLDVMPEVALLRVLLVALWTGVSPPAVRHQPVPGKGAGSGIHLVAGLARKRLHHWSCPPNFLKFS